MTVTLPPVPRRIGRPRWLDIRVIGGVLLLVASVAIGAKVIGAAARTSPVWSVAHDLSAGTVLTAADLVPADVNLADVAGVYLSASATALGQQTNRDLAAGELLPAAAVRAVGDGRVLSISVSPDRMAPGVAHGSRVDLYLVSGRAAVGEEVRTSLLQADVTVQTVTAPASGGLSGAVSNRYQVALLLPPSDAEALIPQLALGDVLVVARTRPVAQADEGGR